MQKNIAQLEVIVEKYSVLLRSVNKNLLEKKSSPVKWSRKETIGHMIDSAQNNIRRFIVAQYEDQPHIVYKQDDWVKLAGYQQSPASDLIELWILLNKQLIMILKNIPEEKQKNICISEASHSLEWLAVDYNKHVLHHLHQVLDLEPVAYP